RGIGYVIQQIGLFPHMTIGQNVALVPKLKKMDPAAYEKKVDELLDMVGLDPKVYKNRYPAQLSGGQQQRVGVIRALAADPPIIL
ncbi:ATP-binding cassette domain-containing protein, partial [Enterococcus faecium]